MKFFDSLIDRVSGLISETEQKPLSVGIAWHDAGGNQVIMRRDTAFELEGVGFNLVTSGKIRDEITVIGDDLDEITENRRFARISIVEIEDIGDEQKAYNLIKKIDYVKYHCFPDGYMMRSTSRSHKEAVRISKDALRNGMDFQRVGSLMIEKYKEIPEVRGVRFFFITNPKADFSAIEDIAKKISEVAQTLNHVMNSVNFDCDTCNLKAVCDEVEGMRELHFKASNRMV